MDNILDHVVVQGQRYDIVSPTAFGDNIETIGSACINPDGYAQGSTFLARLGNEQFYYEATAAITQGSSILEGTNCKKTTVTGREAELASEIETLGETVDSLNEALTNEVETRATLGAHNLFNYDIGKVKSANTDGSWSGNSYTLEGITFTINDDKTVTVNGTASGLAYLYLSLRGGKMFSLPVGSYKETSTPSGNSAVHTEMTYTDANNARQKIGDDYGAGLDFSVTSNMISSYFDIGYNVYVSQGQTVSDVTVKPMIRLASDTDPTYQPYAMTNQQLSEKLKANSIVSGANIFTSIPSGVTLGNYSTLVLAGYLGIIRLQLAITDSIAAWAPIISVKESYRPSVSSAYFVDLTNIGNTVFLNNNGDIVTNRSLSNGDNVLIYGVYPIK